jgi:o-succinylbenzoate synthase
MDRLIIDVPGNISATFERHTLVFRQPAGTSRGVLTEKKLWLLRLSANGITGTGECSVIPGLSPDYRNDGQYEAILQNICGDPQKYLLQPELLVDSPSVLFGLECAFLDLKNGGKQLIFDNAFSRREASIPINGLIWMGSEEFMEEQIAAKIGQGFRCIKMKVGAIDFDREVRLLDTIRRRFPASEMMLRVDANGAFSPEEAFEKLSVLARLDIHSIEQPIRAGQTDAMAELCTRMPLPVALDEELIGVTGGNGKRDLLEKISPQYIILKPSLHGGISGTREWISIAGELGIPWWITSALESNIGLNAIAQLTGCFDVDIPQGLGTGGLFTSNFPSTLNISEGRLFA